MGLAVHPNRVTKCPECGARWRRKLRTKGCSTDDGGAEIVSAGAIRAKARCKCCGYSNAKKRQPRPVKLPGKGKKLMEAIQDVSLALFLCLVIVVLPGCVLPHQVGLFGGTGQSPVATQGPGSYQGWRPSGGHGHHDRYLPGDSDISHEWGWNVGAFASWTLRPQPVVIVERRRDLEPDREEAPVATEPEADDEE